MRELQGIVVHASATPSTMDIGVAEIDRWHRRNGWRMIGYHFVVRRDGTVEDGRPVEQSGAHAKGFNRHTIGICVVGGTTKGGEPEDNFTDKQYATLLQLLVTFKRPHMWIKGHRDLPHVAKDCPCFDVAEFVAKHEAAFITPEEK